MLYSYCKIHKVQHGHRDALCVQLHRIGFLLMLRRHGHKDLAKLVWWKDEVQNKRELQKRSICLTYLLPTKQGTWWTLRLAPIHHQSILVSALCWKLLNLLRRDGITLDLHRCGLQFSNCRVHFLPEESSGFFFPSLENRSINPLPMFRGRQFIHLRVAWP